MRKRPGTIRLEVDEQDFGTICICALRYSMGRQTYMPSLVRDFIRPLLPKICSKSLRVMINDCEEQARCGNYGHPDIDRPGWVEWHRELLAEKERRGNEQLEEL